MLNSALLNLDSFYYTEINVSVDIDAVDRNAPCTLTTENLCADFSVHSDLVSDGNAILSLKVTTDSEADLSLSISVGIIGKFDLTDELKAKISNGSAKEETVITNSLSILYASIRELGHSLTAKTPLGPQFLPTCNFSVEKKIKEQEPAPAEKKQRKAAPKKTA
jgi:hypothetical protein